MKSKFLKSAEKKKIIEEMESIYGINKIPHLLLETGKRKIRGFSGNLTKEEIIELSQSARIEIIGMYLISQKDAEPRLNFDAVPLFKNQITKNILEIDKEQLEKWIRGHDLEVKTKRGTTILKYENDLVGVGKSNTEKIFNYVPKERKLKTQLPKS